jgi:hypothetical protein
MRTRALRGIALAAVLAGCGGGGGTTTVREPRGALTVDKGRTLVLAFSTNPGVGLAWEPGAPSPDPAVLQPRGWSTTGADRPGASAEVSYRFAARSSGTTAVGFVHFFRGKVLERRAVRVTVR